VCTAYSTVCVLHQVASVITRQTDVSGKTYHVGVANVEDLTSGFSTSS
jgi:hypothetical protein